MECANSTVATEVPPQYVKATTSSVSFFKVASALEQLEVEEAVKKHTIFTTSHGYMVEAEAGKVLRTARTHKDVIKIVIHHDFQPLQLYIVLLCSSKKASLLAYQDFKQLHEWQGIQDITSSDPQASGTPHLVLTQMTGELLSISNTKLLSLATSSDQEEEEEEQELSRGKRDAVEALAHRLQGWIRHAEQLRSQRKVKENFIVEELAVLQAQLQGQDSKGTNLMTALTVEGGQRGDAGRKAETTCPTSPSLPPTPLRILQVRYKLVHDKWVIGLNVINDSERVLVCQPEITLQLGSGQGALSYTSQILKSVMHSQPGSQGGTSLSASDVRVTIGQLDPPVLRPKKRAIVVGVCDIPAFEEGPSVSCTGVLSYICKSLDTEATLAQASKGENHTQKYQVSFPAVQLRANELHQHLVTLEQKVATRTAGITFSSVALVAASKCNIVSFSSQLSPLTMFLSQVSEHLKLVKICGVSDFYVLHPRESHPLQHAGFTLHSIDSHNLTLKLYTRDEKQALLLVHSLLAALPKDTIVLSPTLTGDSSQAENHKLYHMLLARMRDAVTSVVDGLEAQLSSSKTPRLSPSRAKEGRRDREESEGNVKYRRERQELLDRKGDVTFEGKEYSMWRKKLCDVQLDMDTLYIKYLKLNCNVD